MYVDAQAYVCVYTCVSMCVCVQLHAYVYGGQSSTLYVVSHILSTFLLFFSVMFSHWAETLHIA